MFQKQSLLVIMWIPFVIKISESMKNKNQKHKSDKPNRLVNRADIKSFVLRRISILHTRLWLIIIIPMKHFLIGIRRRIRKKKPLVAFRSWKIIPPPAFWTTKNQQYQLVKKYAALHMHASNVYCVKCNLAIWVSQFFWCVVDARAHTHNANTQTNILCASGASNSQWQHFCSRRVHWRARARS